MILRIWNQNFQEVFGSLFGRQIIIVTCIILFKTMKLKCLESSVKKRSYVSVHIFLSRSDIGRYRISEMVNPSVNNGWSLSKGLQIWKGGSVSPKLGKLPTKMSDQNPLYPSMGGIRPLRKLRASLFSRIWN